MTWAFLRKRASWRYKPEPWGTPIRVKPKGAEAGLHPPFWSSWHTSRGEWFSWKGPHRELVREAPASSQSFAPVVKGLAYPGGYLGSNRPPKFNSKRDTWPLWSEKFTSFTSIKGCRDAYTETPNPVRVADESLTNGDLLLRHLASTIVHARLALEFLLEALNSDPPCLTRMLETKSPSGAWKVMTDFYAPKTNRSSTPSQW